MSAVNTVGVIGAGISGLAAAIRLAQEGIEVDLLEAQETLTILGSGISLQINALRAFQELGAWDDIRTEGYAFDGLVLRAPGPGGPVISRRGGATGPDSLPSAMGMPRPELARILLAHARAAGVNVRFGARVTGLDQSADRVTVQGSDGDLGTYDLVIGADGLHSAVRGMIGIETAPETTGMGIWRAFVSRPNEVATTELYYGGPAYIAGYTPTGEDSMYAYLVFDAEDHFRTPADAAARIMIERSHAYGGPWETIRADLAAGGAEVNYTWFTRHIVDAPWNRGRVVLIGDAAHSCPPTIAQGAAQALEDALVIADVLTRRDTVDEELWNEFHERRVDRARAVVDASVQLAEWQRDGEDHAHEMPQLIGELQRRIENPV